MGIIEINFIKFETFLEDILVTPVLFITHLKFLQK